MKKKWIFAFFLVFASISFAKDRNPNRISEKHWSYDSLNYISQKGILKDAKDRIDASQKVSQAEFIYSLAQLLKLVDLEKAKQSDLQVLEALMLQYSNELNQISFDTKSFDAKIENAYDNIQILQERVNENEKQLDTLLRRVEQLENKNN